MFEQIETMPVWAAVLALAASFYVLTKGASLLVDGAVGIAERLRVPKLLIGIVLVGLATTAPEFAVSFISAIQNSPEMALGNAVGSVIVDDGVALALVGLLSATPVAISMRTLRQAAVFLVTIDLAAFALILLSPAVSPAGTPVYVLTRAGGITLLALFFAYLVYIVWDRRKFPPGPEELAHELGPAEAASAGRGLGALVFWFAAGLVLVIGGSEVVVGSARNLATALSIPRTVISLTIVAIGTSVPEIATCVAAARKGEGALAVGDIVGADILNIAWVAGASATVNPLAIARPEILFMFPAMLVIVGTMLTGLFLAGRMTRALGVVLVTEYVVYMTLMATYFV